MVLNTNRIVVSKVISYSEEKLWRDVHFCQPGGLLFVRIKEQYSSLKIIMILKRKNKGYKMQHLMIVNACHKKYAKI